MSDGVTGEFVFSFGAVLPFVALAVSAFLGAYLFGLNPRGPANRSVLLVMLAFVMWDAGEAIQRSFAPGTSTETLFFWARFTWVAIVLVPATLYQLAITYPAGSGRFRRPWLLAAIYAPFVGWAYLVAGTTWIIDGISTNPFGPDAHVAPTFGYFAIVFSAWMFSAVALFVRSYWQMRSTPSRRMLGIVLGGLLLGTLPAAVTEVAWPLLTQSPTRLGLGSLYTLVWSIFIAYAVVRYRYLVIEPVIETRAMRAPRHRLESGLNYLVLENGRGAAMGAFREIVSKTPGLCVTGLAPSHVAARFGLERTPILWITTATSEGRTVRPNAPHFQRVHTGVKFRRGILLTTEHPSKARLRYGDRFDIVWVTDRPEAGLACVRPKALDAEGRRAIANYASSHGHADIVLVGLEQLALYVDTRAWLPFIKDSLDIAGLHECRFFLTAAPEAIRPREFAMLSRRFDTPLSAAALKSSLPSEPTTTAAESRIPYRGPSA